MKNNNETDLVFTGEIFAKEKETKKDENSLQRTKLWLEQRKGNWTGSQFKNLMTCSPKGGKLPWNAIEKRYMISSGALKYIFANLMERKTGRYITTDSTKEMKYGTIIEPLIYKAANEKLKPLGLYLELVGYKVFENTPTAGVSSDAVVRKIVNDEIIASCEMKACASWGTYFDRTFEKLSETDKDFWQTQGQMLAWNVDKNYYIVAEPVEDISKYLYYSGDIIELYDEWMNETSISLEIVEISPIHIAALETRIEIAESTVQRTLKEGVENIKEIFYEEIENFKSLSKDTEPVIINHSQPESFHVEQPDKETEDRIPAMKNSPPLIKEKTFQDVSDNLPF